MNWWVILIPMILGLGVVYLLWWLSTR